MPLISHVVLPVHRFKILPKTPDDLFYRVTLSRHVSHVTEIYNYSVYREVRQMFKSVKDSDIEYIYHILGFLKLTKR